MARDVSSHETTEEGVSCTVSEPVVGTEENGNDHEAA